MREYVFLGILQGIFEWLPISSEGVTALAGKFLLEDLNPVDVALFLHLGTVFAVLLYFRKEWREVLGLKKPKLLRFLAVSTLVSFVIGYPIYKLVKNAAIGTSLLLITGFGLLLTAFFHKKRIDFKLAHNRLAVLVGFLQGLAVIPGFSRSGSTIFGLSLGDFSKEEMLKISYMMSVPIVLASSAYLFLENPQIASRSWPSLVSSFVTGILSLHLLMNLAKKINFFKFALFFSLLCFLGAVIGYVS